MSGDEPDLLLRSRAGYGGARSRMPLPNQNQHGEHLEGGYTGVEQDPSQQVAGERQNQSFIDRVRDKCVLVAMAMVAFNVVWLIFGGWVFANILFVVAFIYILKGIRSVTFSRNRKCPRENDFLS